MPKSLNRVGTKIHNFQNMKISFVSRNLLLLCCLSMVSTLTFGQWGTSGNDIYNTNTGNVRIGGYVDSASKLIIGGRLRIIGFSETIRSSFISSDNTNSTFRIAHPSSGVVALGGNVDHQLQLGGFVYDGSSFSPRMTILTDGKVGINTTTATHQLSIASADDNTLRLMGPNGSYGYGSSLNFGDGDYVYLRETNDDQLTIFASSGAHFLGGNVGIGTATPNKGKLHVKGGMHVENNDGTELLHIPEGSQHIFIGSHAYDEYVASGSGSIIQSDSFALWVSKGVVSEDFAIAEVHEWDDYVFAEDYELPTLATVSQFVKANKHLPNIPSEATVKQEGYSLHQLNRNFLKTIEELTLYTIAQEEKIQKLEEKLSQLEDLKAEMMELKTLMVTIHQE